MIPPITMDFLYPQYLSATSPPINGVKKTKAMKVPYKSEAYFSDKAKPASTSLR